MRRYVFPVLMGVVGVAILMSLGFWQLRRMEEKRVYLDQIEARISNAPIPLPAQPNEARDKFQAVFAEGTFTGEYLEVLTGQKGGSPGVMAIEAFDLGNGRRIMVQRGFVEEEARKVPRARPRRRLARRMRRRSRATCTGRRTPAAPPRHRTKRPGSGLPVMCPRWRQS